MKFLILLSSLIAININASDRPHLEADEVNVRSDMCPKVEALKGHSGKFGHTVVLVDTTTSLSSPQFALLEKLVFDESILKKIQPYDRLSILNLTGIDIQASQNEYIFSMCRPRNGEYGTPYELDRATFWDSKAQLQRNWRMYLNELDKAKCKLAEQPSGKFTQLYEQLKELSRIPDLKFRDNDGYEYRKLIIVSDFLQYSNNLDLYPSCLRKGQCVSWESVKNDRQLKQWIEFNLPKFRDSPPEVEFIYLNANADPKLNIGLIDFWDSYFAEVGINKINKEAETSSSVKEEDYPINSCT